MTIIAATALVMVTAAVVLSQSSGQQQSPPKAPAGRAQQSRALSAPATDDASPSKPPTLDARALDAMMARQALREVSLGVTVMDVETGRLLYGHKAGQSLIPASNMKLATTAAALLSLGPDWHFRTVIGTLGDDLVVIGGGDPNLSGRFYADDAVGPFRQWARILKNRGITHIRGNLVVDDFLFDDDKVHSGWPVNQYQLWYAAPVGALTANDSCIDITIRPGPADGAPAMVTLSPPTAYIDVRGSIATRRDGKNAPVADRPRNSRQLKLSGQVPLGSGAQKYYRTVDDPGLFAGTVILETLRREGIRIDGNAVRRRVYGDDWTLPSELSVQLVHTSSLASSVNVCNTRSQNLYAECILKVMGALGGEGSAGIKRQGSWATGNAEVERVLSAAGIDLTGCTFDDGGGLSRGNRLSAQAIGEILVTMGRSGMAQQWRGSLAEAGDSEGTLRRWQNEALLGRVHAKTGYLNNARALSGYVQTDSGRWLAFSILANMPYKASAHTAVKQLQEDLLTQLVTH